MTLQLLGLLVVFGISGIVLLVHFTGGSQAVSLLQDDDIRAAWHADWPHDKPLKTIGNTGGTAALIHLPNDALGLIWSFGADTVSRTLTAGSLRSVKARGETLIVQFNAFDCPTARIPLTRRELPEWHAQLAPYLPQEVPHG